MNDDIMLHTDRRGDEYWLDFTISDEEVEEEAEEAAFVAEQEYSH